MIPRSVPLALLLAACGRPGVEHGADSRAAADSVAGIVTEIGADPATQLSLASAAGGAPRLLVGDSAQPMRSVSGAEVVVLGAPGAEGFRVTGFTVRSVSGMAVDDGVVTRGAGGLELVMRGGARRPLPAQLEPYAGQRVWVTRPESGRAPSFGVIR